MDKQLFEQLLTDNAHWYKPNSLNELLKTPRRRRQQALEQENLEDDTFTEEPSEIDLHKVNESYPPVVVKVKTQATICDDCQRHCDQGRRKERKLYVTVTPHWRSRCVTCKMNQNPVTGKFDLTDRYAALAWNNWLRREEKKKSTSNNQG